MNKYDLMRKWGLTADQLEEKRRALSGTFVVEHRGPDGALIDKRVAPNIVTNEGLNYALDVALSGGTQITAWKVALSKSTDAPQSTDTYAADGFTEISSTDVSETVRQAWSDGGVSGQSVTNSTGGGAVYTSAVTTLSVYGAALKGGGTASTTIGDSAGGGTMYSMSKFAAVKNISTGDTLAVSYTFTAADA